jgi:Dolichyl-phosphate-mannose-protein mannosyltransferase
MNTIVPKLGILLAAEPRQQAAAPRAWPGDLAGIGVILLLAFAARFWVLRHTEVLSRDSIGFIRFALQLERPTEGMTRLDVVRGNAQPPGYPLALLVVSQPVRSCLGETTCDSMVLSAQLTSILASLLLVFPMYFVGKMLFDRQTAFIATLLYQVLPVCTQVTSDGLSDSVYLLMAMIALWFGALGLRRGATGWFAAAGLFAGLAYLVRPEGLASALVLGLVALGLTLRGVWSRQQLLTRGCALATGLLLVMTPYVATIGKLTNKPTGEGFLKGDLHPSWERSQSSAPAGVNVPLAEWWNPEKGDDSARSLWAVKALTVELVKASFYVLPLFAIAGLLLLRQRIRDDAAVLLFVVLGAMHLLLLWFVASRAGYVAERHTLLLVLIGSYFSAAAIAALGVKLASIPRLGRIGSATFWTAVIAIALIAAALPAGMKTLHANRAGHRAAGLWIAQHREPNDFVEDPFAWADFYAGNLRTPSTESEKVRVVFVVLEGIVGNPHPRLHQMPRALKFAEHGKFVYHWPPNAPVEKGKVFVYRLEFAPPPIPPHGEALPLGSLALSD